MELGTALVNKKKKKLTTNGVDKKTEHYEHGSTIGKSVSGKNDPAVNKMTFQEALKLKSRG